MFTSPNLFWDSFFWKIRKRKAFTIRYGKESSLFFMASSLVQRMSLSSQPYLRHGSFSFHFESSITCLVFLEIQSDEGVSRWQEDYLKTEAKASQKTMLKERSQV